MIEILLSGVVGILIGIIVMIILAKAGITKAKNNAELIISEAENKAENLLKSATLEGKTIAHEFKLDAERSINEKKDELQEFENQLLRKEDNINFRDETLLKREKEIDSLNREIEDKMAMLDDKEAELDANLDKQAVELERIASMSQESAKKELMDIVEKRMDQHIANYLKEREDHAKSIADESARNIIALSIQKLCQDESFDRTVSVVNLPNEEMKGRIIGREGRNIRAIEQATGVDLNIDDTPEVITLSCFNPIRREIARQSLEILIKDGRIQPGRIEEVVKRVKRDLDEHIQKVGEDTVFKLGIGKMDRELVKMVGKLKYRYSYGQNALEHAVEVANICGIMASELGLNVPLAKRAGLLHDIGKAMDYEVDGSHVELGAKFCKKHGEDDVVINAIESHHGEVEPKYLISNLVYAADTLSAARPGARKETLANYIQRLEDLENICKSFKGVESCYAIQAGREVRVMVNPKDVDDAQANKLAIDIKDRIENEMTYPGQIKVTVIRETRANEVAK